MKTLIGALVLLSISAQAYEVKIKQHDTLRKIAGEPSQNASVKSEESLLVYDSPDSKLKNKTQVIDAVSWKNFKNQGATRLDLLLKIYYANIKDVSNSGQRHVGCFLGEAESVAKDFFQNGIPISNVNELYVTVSEDRKMLGLEFSYFNPAVKKPAENHHFRLPHCVQGAKSPLIRSDRIKTAEHGVKESSRSVASVKKIRLPAAINGENGFDIFDKLNALDATAESTKKLPRFALRSDYSEMRPRAEQRPWKGMDIRTEEGGKKFAQAVLDYFYDSLIQDTANNDNNFIAGNIKPDKAQWCHMPWLNVGDSGRELIHGLTKERDLEKSEIYPGVGATKDKEGSDWGIGFYNDIACSALGNIFGSTGQIAATPDFTKKWFPDGSVSVKVLFTTANLEELKSSFTWTANVSLPKSTARKLRQVKMVQVDVAVKDSSLVGVKKEVDGWMMSSFYFDPAYKADSRHNFSGGLAGLLKMRPIGIQTGFDPATSLIFKESKTNSANNIYYGANPRLMNGPADNAAGSCMSCHGAAGTSTKMVPGVKDFKEYAKIRESGLDFSQQLALAKRNYETRAGQKKAAW